MKVYLKNDKKPMCIEICIHSLKYINTFLILYQCAKKFLYVLQCAANQKRLRTANIEYLRRGCLYMNLASDFYENMITSGRLYLNERQG
jgi:hypothetical protein